MSKNIELEIVDIVKCSKKMEVIHSVLVCPIKESIEEKKFCDTFFDIKTKNFTGKNKIIFQDEKEEIIFYHEEFGEVIINLCNNKYSYIKTLFQKVKTGYGSYTWGGQIHLFIDKCK